ncbi:MAG: hypothetical protein KC496_19550 [Anaerolineae bacterium]|nr:hypothetical protein [Anaerolineae bacterium]
MDGSNYKSSEFLRRLKACGKDVQVFQNVLLLKPEMVELEDGVRIDDYARVEGGLGLSIGRYTHMASFASILGGGKTSVGAFAGIAQGARIVTGGGHPFWQHFPVAPPEDDYYHIVRGEVHIGDYAFVAANAVVVPGVTIGEGAIVAAGSVATRDVPPWTVVAGIPARIIKERRNFLKDQQ